MNEEEKDKIRVAAVARLVDKFGVPSDEVSSDATESCDIVEVNDGAYWAQVWVFVPPIAATSNVAVADAT